MELRRGYKMTEVGVIPEDWSAMPIGEFLKIRHGKNQKEVECIDGIYPILGTGGEMGRTNSFLCDKPSVLIGRKGTIDKPRYMETPFWTVDTLFYSEINFDRADPMYIYNWFQQINWYNYNEASGVPSLNSSKIEEIKIPLPPLPEQKAIAQVLSDTDTLIQALQKKINKKRAIKQGAMQQLLKPKEGWERKKIEDVVSISTGSKNTQDKLKDGKYPFFVRSQTVEKINSFTFDCEAVLTAGDGVGTGKIFHYLNGKFEVHQRVYVMSNFGDNLYGYYFYLYFKNNFYDRIMQMTAKSSVDSVRREMIADMEIPLPTYMEQKEIATILSDMDTEIEQLEEKLSKYKNIKQGLMQNLLTGKIRLV